MRIFSDFNEIRSALGTEIGTSDWIEVSREQINPVRGSDLRRAVDPCRPGARGEELPGGTTIAHGLLSLALAPLFIRSVMSLKGLRNTLNYGADRIRYLAPVPAGSRLRGRLTVAEAEDVPPDGLRVNYHLVIEIEGGKRPACVAELIALHYRWTVSAAARSIDDMIPAVDINGRHP